MQMNEGVEWAAHFCLLLHWLEEDDPRPIPGARLAEVYDLPPAYVGKQLQALTRAGLTRSVPGRHGGLLLARPAAEITLMDVVAAIEGTEEAFRCTEIRRRGINAERPAREFTSPCGIAMAMKSAELAWRRELASTTISDLAERTPSRAAAAARRHFTHL
ncbi:Rrf2 family transcriptional regulator [Brachybacterium sp. YJGR34]|uniref:RrF2 family transcriptional regulator n=1 Tax=Brachybacterium sp. YJGR34 TaxID=2059911 RepID=UPI000E09E64D|nr:Rrf2 family transcriptional regulator [Brachybacterium sp. YJGR34]